MPPTSTSRDIETPLHLDLPYLRNEDVAILDAIITAAGTSPLISSRPLHAIFPAYDRILAQHGLAPEHDQLYLRFLFRLGERLGEEKDLRTEFERLLWELGIKIEYVVSDGSAQGDFSVYNENAENMDPHQQEESEWTGHRRERRASFSEVQEVEDEDTRAGKRRADSRASLSRLQDHSAGFGSRPFSTRPRRVADPDLSEEVRAVAAYAAPSRESLKTTNNRRAHQSLSRSRAARQLHQTIERPISRSDNRYRNHRGQEAPEIPIYEDAVDREPTFPRESASIQSRQAIEIDAALRAIYEPSRTQLVRDAQTFRDFNLRILVGDLFRRWRGLALDAELRHQNMLSRAIRVDEDTLRRQAFIEWRQQYLRKRHDRETEIFFEQLNQHAGRARDLHLLTKAFTHWAECTAEEVDRNATARRHVIRLRYFNAWKEITAVNELKIRRHIFDKFFQLWRHKLKQGGERDHHAVTVYQRGLVERIYWDWFWNFCERRAPEWRNAKLKRHYFWKWFLATKARVEQTLQVTSGRGEGLRHQFFYQWTQRTRVQDAQEQQAEDFRRKQLLARCLPPIQREAEFAPRERHIAGMVNWRVASNAFSTLAFRCRLEQQARQIDKRRLLRNVWTAWNDRLRWQTMQHKIADRLAVQALYKWVLAERGVLMTRLREERIQYEALQKLAVHKRRLDQQLNQNYRTITQLRNRHLLTSMFSTWRSTHTSNVERQKQAQDFHLLHKKKESITLWLDACELRTDLSRQAERAIFWWRVKKTLSMWQSAVQESRKQRRLEAYAATRRMIKMNLARRVIQNWREHTREVQELSHQGEDIENRIRAKILFKTFEKWQDRLKQFAELTSEAEKRDTFALLTSILAQWSQRSEDASTNALAASSMLSSRYKKTAYDCLRRLQLKVLEHESLTARASSIFALNERRRARGLLRGWAERAGRRRGLNNEETNNHDTDGPLLPLRGSSLLSLARTPRSSRWAPAVGTTLSTQREPKYQLTLELESSSLSQGTPLFDSPPSQPQEPPSHPPASQPLSTTRSPPTAFTTPLPAYLSTPSRRAARARAFAQSQIHSHFQPRATAPIPEMSEPSSTPESQHQNEDEGPVSFTPQATAPRPRILDPSEAPPSAEEKEGNDEAETFGPPQIHAPAAAATEQRPRPGFASRTGFASANPSIRLNATAAQSSSRTLGGSLGAGGASSVRRSLFPRRRGGGIADAGQSERGRGAGRDGEEQ